MIFHRAVMLGVALAVVGQVPAGAQQTLGNDRETFVNSVDKEDGAKVQELYGKYGKNILNARNGRGDTALTVSMRKRNDWAYFFLAQGADPDLGGAEGDTPLIIASRIGFLGGAEQLIAYGAAVDSRNRRGETPLIVAVQTRQPAIVKLLLENGADPDKKDNFGGRSAREYAQQNSRDREIISLIESTRKKPATAKSADDFRL
ncbi:ankyrin repeat domain-containing protein [Sphingomonas piscis]|uniref:Ankyrin repeat domain-containing protein n=1 Tax=Sphingomonas piscis TaxID=2714943 RepID=A0A6G7YPP3_9SPHN|nr:ankyrin repeat domain-containing protein [Sphingomonas piscis]QIK78709.1 ankyrin repeat domain-containing protein [Sphingomonas piscis]